MSRSSIATMQSPRMVVAAGRSAGLQLPKWTSPTNAACAAAVEAIADRFEHDLLVNNAASSANNLLAALAEDDVSERSARPMWAACSTSLRAVAPRMISQRARKIIDVGSRFRRKGWPHKPTTRRARAPSMR